MTALILAATVKGTVVLALAWAATGLLRKSSADLRHRIWLAALVSLALLAIPVRIPEAASVTVLYTAAATQASVATASPWLTWPNVWATGAFLLLARFTWNLICLARLTANAARTDMADVRTSSGISSPMTWGIFRPVVLLPSYAADWTYALQHERIHIARADWFTQTFAQLVTAVFWFHPLVWFAAARLRLEAEQAVDDAVLSSGAAPASYAEQLLQVARRMRSNSPATAVAMVSRPVLSRRIGAILDATRVRGIASRRIRVAIGLGTLLIVPTLAVLRSSPLPAPPPPPAPAQPVIEPPKVQVPPKPARPRVLIAQAAPAPTPAPIKPAPAPQTPPTPRIVTGTIQTDPNVTRPEVLTKVEPRYSPEAEAAKYQGEVWLSVVIDANGIPTDVTVTRQLGLGLDEEAIKAVNQWRFRPGMKDGEPVATRATIAVSFHHRDN